MFTASTITFGHSNNFLPLAMRVAAQTIGFDLVAVKPLPGPSMNLFYFDTNNYIDIRTSKIRKILEKLK